MGKTLRSLFDEILKQCKPCENKGTCFDVFICPFKEQILKENKKLVCPNCIKPKSTSS